MNPRDLGDHYLSILLHVVHLRTTGWEKFNDTGKRLIMHTLLALCRECRDAGVWPDAQVILADAGILLTGGGYPCLRVEHLRVERKTSGRQGARAYRGSSPA